MEMKEINFQKDLIKCRDNGVKIAQYKKVIIIQFSKSTKIYFSY
jgi:hypothetical protein